MKCSSTLCSYLVFAIVQLSAIVQAAPNAVNCTSLYAPFHRSYATTVYDTSTAYGTTKTITSVDSLAITTYSATTVETSTMTTTFTYFTTVASTTITVPTSSGFVPFASLAPFPPGAATATSTLVNCLTTVTSPTFTQTIFVNHEHTTSGTGTATSTFTTTATTTVHTTISTPTATVYQGCYLSSNQATAYNGLPIAGVEPLVGSGNLIPIAGGAALQSRVDCCNAVFAAAQSNHSISGYAYSPANPVYASTCKGLAPSSPGQLDGWQFVNENASVPVLFLGTGPRIPQYLIYSGKCPNQTQCPYTNQS